MFPFKKLGSPRTSQRKIVPPIEHTRQTVLRPSVTYALTKGFMWVSRKPLLPSCSNATIARLIRRNLRVIHC